MYTRTHKLTRKNTGSVSYFIDIKVEILSVKSGLAKAVALKKTKRSHNSNCACATKAWFCACATNAWFRACATKAWFCACATEARLHACATKA